MPDDYRDALLGPPPYQPAAPDVTVRIAPDDLTRLLTLADRLQAAINRLEDEAERAAPGSAAYEALDEQLELLYQIRGATP